MAEYKVVYVSELDAFQLYHRYNPHRNDDWKTAALRGPALPAIGNAIAGAVGAAISNVATYPLSLIVARLQTQRVLSTKRKSQSQSQPQSSRDEDATEKKDDNGHGEEEEEEEEEEYTSILDAARKIYAHEGISGLYTGLGPDTAKTVADSFLFFLAYTFLREWRITNRGNKKKKNNNVVLLPILDELAVGILAGAFGKLWTTPLANIVTRKQTGCPRTNTSPPTTSDIAAQIRSKKGLMGFWSGYSASLILTLNPSITLLLNEVLKRTLLPRAKRHRPSAATTFLLAALSKAAASSITYPFSLAKTRAQANHHHHNINDSDPSIRDPRCWNRFAPQVIQSVLTISQSDGLRALYAGLPAEILKGFFSHGFTILAKDLVYSLIVHAYSALLLLLRRYPSPADLIQRAREHADMARENAKDLVATASENADHVLTRSVAVDMTSSVDPAASKKVFFPDEGASESNETAELVGDYVEDEAAEWRSLYHWFREREKTR